MREQILDRSLELMSAHGSARMSMRQLARACGVNVAAIYHYFESKDSLLEAVIDERQYSTRLAVEVPALDKRWSPERRLRAMFHAVWEGALAEEPIWRLVLVEGLAGTAASLPAGRRLLAVSRDGFAAWLADAIPEVAKTDAVAELMVSQLLLAILQHIYSPETATAEIGAKVADALVAVAF
jgi:AcrR family transcriptional regulator